MIEATSCGGVVIHRGKILTLYKSYRNRYEGWVLPKGTVEAGETHEQTALREVLEEAGVTVRDVAYVASQPWPFPSSLMIGCHAMAEGTAITIDTNELEEARWFSRAEVEAAMAGDPAAPFIAPPIAAIAHQLLRWWLAR